MYVCIYIYIYVYLSKDRRDGREEETDGASSHWRKDNILELEGGLGLCSRYSDPLRVGWTGDRILGEIFRTRSNQHWDPPSLLCNGYRVYFSGVKQPRRGVDNPHIAPRLKKE
jgi:hypothetical protein